MGVAPERRSSCIHRFGDETGANAVEFALVLPLLLVLVFGMLTGGISLNQKLGLEQANREAARWGATLPLENCGAVTGTPPDEKPDDCWFADVANNAVLSANGELGNGVPDRVVCVAFIHEDAVGNHSKSLTWDRVTTDLNASNATSTGTQCFGDGLSASTAHVQVLVSRSGSLNLVFYGHDLTLESRSVAMFEPPRPYD